MKLSHIIHPEIVLGTRGPKERHSRYSLAHQCINFELGKGFSVPSGQRCGPGLTQVKLIWVAEHERHFNVG